MDPLTGERLDDGHALYRADLARHRAAYHFANATIGRGTVLDLGCGTGYGTVLLAAPGRRVVGLDRVAPASRARGGEARFARGALERLPFASGCAEAVVSFQVIEHFDSPTRYVAELARTLAQDGVLLVSTPNRLTSDGENPHHLHEYTADELAEALARFFAQVELRGIHARGPAAQYHAARLRQIRRLTRLDPLGLRRRLPRAWLDPLFASASLVVRWGLRGRGRLDDVEDRHYEVGAVDPGCLDLLALCRMPREAPRRG